MQHEPPGNESENARMDGLSFRPGDRLRSLRTGTLRPRSIAQVVPVFCSASAGTRKMIVPLCEFEGFYEPECCQDVRFAWTRQVATVVCHFMEPVAVRHIWLMIASAAPGGSHLSVVVQDGPCVTLPRVLRNRIVRVPLGRKVKRSTFQIRLECQTFVPNDRLNNGDCRELGIALRRVILGRNWIACLRGLQVDPQPDASLQPNRAVESRAA